MPSPFPGMNPYLEQEDVRHDFHERFIPLVATLLGGQLRPRYIVKIDEHVFVHELPAESRRLVGRADLLRGGPPLPAGGRPECSYSVLVSCFERRPDAAFWPIALRERLPVIPVPVRAPDSDARLDLQAVIDRIYDDAGYGDYIYEGAPRPRLEGDDADWARQLLPLPPT